MRQIRIIGQDKIEELIQVVAINCEQIFFISKKVFEELKGLANPCFYETPTMNFIVNHDGIKNEITIKFKQFCNMYYTIETVAGTDFEIYAKPTEQAGRVEIVIGAE